MPMFGIPFHHKELNFFKFFLKGAVGLFYEHSLDNSVVLLGCSVGLSARLGLELVLFEFNSVLQNYIYT